MKNRPYIYEKSTKSKGLYSDVTEKIPHASINLSSNTQHSSKGIKKGQFLYNVIYTLISFIPLERFSKVISFHTFVICCFLTLSSSLQAEESNIWDNFLGFFSSGDNQGEECDEGIVSQELAEQIRSEVCPQFLMKQVIKRDQKTMIFSNTSAEKLCYDNSKRREDSVFKTPQELESYLRDKEPFSKINTVPTADCLSHSVSTGFGGRNRREHTLSEDKKKTVLAEYYLTQQRLENGMSGILQDITAIDQLIGGPPLNKVNCNKFQLNANILEECQSLQQCPSSKGSLNPVLAEETIEAMRAIKAIDKRIDKLDGPRGRHAERNASQIKELRERKASLQSLYPWTAGKIFLDQYDENAGEEKTIQLIKEQLSYTRKRLEKNIHEMQGAVSCIRYNIKCRDVDYDKVMAKTPLLSYEEMESIFQVGKEGKIQSMSESELASLPDEERRKLSEEMNINNTALGYVIEAQCRQDTRESVSEVRKELGFLVLDVGLTIATVGLGAAAIAGRLSIRAGSHISKAQRLQNIGLMGVDISFSAPYISQAIDDCDDYMNQLEQKAGEETDDICKELPVRSKLKSDLTSCLLTASLASLPLAVPAFAVAGRAGFKAGLRAVEDIPPPAPKGPTPPTQPTPTERQLTGPNATPAANSNVVRSSDQAPSNEIIDTVEDGVVDSSGAAQRATPASQPKISASTADQPNLLPAPISKQTRTKSLPTPTPKQTAGTKSPSSLTEQKTPQRNTETASGKTQARNSSSGPNSQRTERRFFRSLKDEENRAQGLAKRIRKIIIENNIGKNRKNSLGDFLQQTRTHLRQQNPGMNEAQISQTIARELKNTGVNIEYAKGIFKIKNNEGVFLVDSKGKMKKITENSGSSRVASRRRPNTTNAVRSGALVSRRASTPPARRARRQTTGPRKVSNPGQQGVAAIGRTARAANPKPGNSIAPGILAGQGAKMAGTSLLMGGATAGGAAAAATAAADNSSDRNNENSNADSSGNNEREDDRDESRNERKNNEDRERDEYEDEDEDEDDDNEDENKDKKDDLDCSTYKGGAPQNRKEMICYYYARTQQLAVETQNIQKNTQALNNFKSQVWLGIKSNQVPPNFFTNIQRSVQKNKSVTADYLNNFRLMYDISRIQNQYLNANDQNRLRQIIQNTDQYMNSANLDGYSHIQESVNILMNRLQIPPGVPLFSL